MGVVKIGPEPFALPPGMVDEAGASRIIKLTVGTLRMYRADSVRRGPRFFKVGNFRIAYNVSDLQLWLREQAEAFQRQADAKITLANAATEEADKLRAEAEALR